MEGGSTSEINLLWTCLHHLNLSPSLNSRATATTTTTKTKTVSRVVKSVNRLP